MSIILWGQHPRSEKLVQATRNFDRNRITKEELQTIFDKDRQELIALQKGFPYLSTGQLQWDDLMRPLSKLSPELSQGALTRFFETNTFWRSLEATNEPKLDVSLIDRWIDQYFPFVQEKNSVYTFPFWFLFQHFSKPQIHLDLFLPLFEKLPPGLLVFVEPTFGWEDISLEDKQSAHQFLNQLKQRTSLTVALITTFQNITQDKDYLFQLPVDGLGIDFYHNTVDSALCKFPKDKFLIAGVLNTDSTRMESTERLKIFAEAAQRHVSKGRIYYTHNAPAELLPLQIMNQKIKNLQGIIG